MQVVIPDRTLRELCTNASAKSPYPEGVVKAFRKLVVLMQAAVDERDFRAFGKGLSFEKLKGDRSHQHSFRLNDQFRLIVEIRGEAPQKVLEVCEIVDYH
jgi:toxin HigB-1